jgi:hypothetical protein
MRRLSSALVTFALVAQPLSAFAAYETPGAVLQAVRFDSSAKMISAEVHGTDGTLYVSAWLKGKTKGMEYADAKVDAQVTVDVEDTASHMKGRFKGSVRLVSGNLYAKLDSMEGTFEDDALLGTVHLMTKKWISIPVDEDTVMEIQDMLNQTGDPAEADNLYTMTRTPYQYGSSYTLTMKEGTDMPFSTLSMKIDTDYKDAVQVSQMNFEGMADDFTFNGQAKAERMKTALTVEVPADAVSFDWLMQHLGSIEPSSLFDGADVPMNLEDDWIEINDEEDDIAPVARPRTPRVRTPEKSSEPVDRVNPGVTKPSRRTLKMGGNTNRK